MVKGEHLPTVYATIRINYSNNNLNIKIEHAYIHFANKILEFKNNGINMIKGRTACLAEDINLAAADHSQKYPFR